MSSDVYVCRHSWSVIAVEAGGGPRRLGSRGDLAGHHRAVHDLARPRAALALRGVGEDRPDVSAIGGRRWVPASLFERMTRMRMAIVSPSRTSGELGKVAPGDMRGTGLPDAEGFAGLRWGLLRS